MTARLGKPGLLPRAQLVLAAIAAFAFRLFLIWRFPADAGDVAIYEGLARNWLQHGVYGLEIGGRLTPVDIRMPGYPAFLAAIHAFLGPAQEPVMVAQAVVDTATCLLTALLAARLTSKPAGRAPWAAPWAAPWLAALCPFTANYTAVLLTETLVTFLTVLAVLFLLEAAAGARDRRWFWGGLLAGLGTLVRPETPLLLAAFGLVLAFRWRRRADWRRLLRAGVLMAAGLTLPLLPWAARNWVTLHRVQFLTPRHAEMPGEFVPVGFQDWTATWLWRYGDVYQSVWKIEEEPIRIEDLPASAFDSPRERARVAALLEEYNRTLTATPRMDAAFEQLARERTARRPLRTWLRIPLARAFTIWFTPRIELLPYSGGLWPPGEKWEEDPWDFSVTLLFGVLNVCYVALALLGAWRARRNPALAFLLAFFLLRTALITQVEAPEPRYTLVMFPAVLAICSLAFHSPRRHKEHGGSAEPTP